MTPEQSMRNYLAECTLHAAVLDEGLLDAKTWMPLTHSDTIEKEMLRILDQIAYRFAKLQDSMGEKVLPLILQLAQETLPENATFAEKLNRLERIGAIPSVEEWKKFRIVRNSIAHDYADDPEMRNSAINRFLEGAGKLSGLFKFVKAFVAIHFAIADRQEPHEI